MAADDFRFAMANTDTYAPIEEHANPGRTFAPSEVPAGWTATRHGIWTGWDTDGTALPEQGWKIHVSARLDLADGVLDTVASVCFEEGVPFKHLSAELFFLDLHHKHGPRSQAGKFCAIYPGDVETARRLLDRLSTALADEEGPYILSDRRYRDSRTVHYRYGAFLGRARLRPDGTHEELVRDGDGNDVTDVRGPGFTLPPGITDPFAEPAEDDETATINGYEFLKVLQHSNAGGAYQAQQLSTGRIVFIKEARAHNGLYFDHSTARSRLRREFEALTAVHAAAPGLCPEPVEMFREWEHDFLVTEFVEGTPLNRWTARNDPSLRGGTAAERRAHLGHCRTILERLDAVLNRLHGLGYRFGDLNPRNVLIGDDLGVRLIDFEAATHRDTPDPRHGTPGYLPPRPRPELGPFHGDAYAMAALAQCLLQPLHSTLERSPANAAHMRRDLEDDGTFDPELWRRMTVFTDETAAAHLPPPDLLAADPEAGVEALLAATRRGVLALVDPERPERMTPTTAKGLVTNGLSLAHGSAGVVHALHTTGSVPEPVLDRFRRDALDRYRSLPPGLHTGAAGVAWVLARTGHLDEAETVLAAADDHPLTLLSTTLGEGVAGIGRAHLAMHDATGDQRHLDHAERAAAAIAGHTDLTPTLGPRNAHGLLHGRAGLALFLREYALRTGDERATATGRRLLHAELDRAMPMPGGLSFPEDSTAWRAMPYLYSGAAGMALVMSHYAHDDRVATTLPRLAPGIGGLYTVYAGLYCGLAGLMYANAAAGDADLRRTALRQGTALAKYAVPYGDGIAYIGQGWLRLSAELWSGGSGILLALHHLRYGDDGGLFGLDADRTTATRTRRR